MARSNLIPNAFIWRKSYNVHFSITVSAEFIIVKPIETMVLYKVPDVKLTFDLLSKATHLECHTPV